MPSSATPRRTSLRGGGRGSPIPGAVGADNVELGAARERGLVVHSRASLLAEPTRLKRTIAVGGTHGNTTTSSMVVWALRAAGLDPSLVRSAALQVQASQTDIGARGGVAGGRGRRVLTVRSLSSRSRSPCCSTSSSTTPTFSADARRAMLALFALFLARGRHATCSTTRLLAELRPDAERVAPQDVRLHAGGSRFTVSGQAASSLQFRGSTTPSTPREPTRRRSPPAPTRPPRRAAWRSSQGRAPLPARTEHATARRSSRITPTTRRRWRRRSPPRERSSPSAWSRSSTSHVLPHRLFAYDFGRGLAAADVALVLDVYPARERAAEHPGVSGLLVARAAAQHRPGMPVLWAPTQEDAFVLLDRELRNGDVCLVMGAGDVDALARRLAVQLRGSPGWCAPCLSADRPRDGAHRRRAPNSSRGSAARRSSSSCLPGPGRRARRCTSSAPARTC